MSAQKILPAERRRHPRAFMQIKLRCVRLDPDGENVLDFIHAIDISRSGIGVISSRPFYPGQRILLCLPQTETTGQRNICASVIRSRLAEDKYHVGLEFDRSIASDWCNISAPVALAA
ncbi:MAG: PilZ domain-containing protein [Phycisphaerae bacterium]